MDLHATRPPTPRPKRDDFEGLSDVEDFIAAEEEKGFTLESSNHSVNVDITYPRNNLLWILNVIIQNDFQFSELTLSEPDTFWHFSQTLSYFARRLARGVATP